MEAPHSHREQLLPQEVLHLQRLLLKRRRKRRKPRRRKVTMIWVSPSLTRLSLGFESFTIFQNDRISLWGDVYNVLVLCRGLHQSKAWCSMSWNCHEAYMEWCWWMYYLSHITRLCLALRMMYLRTLKVVLCRMWRFKVYTWCLENMHVFIACACWVAQSCALQQSSILGL